MTHFAIRQHARAAGESRPPRPTPSAARGGPAIWLMALALLVAIGMIVTLLALIAGEGLRTFWPRPIDRVVLREGALVPGVEQGRVVLGVPVRQEAYQPGAAEEARLAALLEGGEIDESAVLAADGRPIRRLYRVGNADLYPQAFRWIPLYEIAGRTRPAEALLIERTDWGVFVGAAEALLVEERLDPSAPVFGAELRETEMGPATVERELVEPAEGDRYVLERRRIALEGDRAWPVLRDAVAAAAERRRRIRELERGEIARVNHRISEWSLRLREAELRRSDAEHNPRVPIPAWAWVGALAGVVVLALLWRALLRAPAGQRPPRARQLAARAAAVLATALALVALLEHPWSRRGIDTDQLEAVRVAHDEAVERLRAQGGRLDGELAELRLADSQWRLVVREATLGRFAPVEQSQPQTPMRLSQVVRIVPGNDLSLAGKVRVYLSRWVEFLTAEPRNSNTEGGVFPVIVGTVTLTLLLTVAVVPLGVIAAIYLREYARQGLATSAIRVAVNNLAGVPSIVYGVFGLGFFSYTIGQFVDEGPDSPLPRPLWWVGVAMLLLLVLAAMVTALLSRPPGGGHERRPHRYLRWGSTACWVLALVGVAAMVASTPYFSGAFRARASMNISTFGTGGVLWASLTLALLTLPVVIVATEEAIAAVPRSLREGSYGAGASRWQTIRRIVLPGAMPGIMTGAVLAIARGAGEVAPLMLVGVMKLAPELPISTEPPFLHAQRSFMHLGFHIFDLGFQSPDSEAARPLVWTTTLLLVGIVLTLNLAAIVLRSRLRSSQASGL